MKAATNQTARSPASSNSAPYSYDTRRSDSFRVDECTQGLCAQMGSEALKKVIRDDWQFQKSLKVEVYCLFIVT